MTKGNAPFWSQRATRRQFLGVLGLGAGSLVLSSCGAPKSTATPLPTVPEAVMGLRTATPAPTAPPVLPTPAADVPTSFKINGVTVPCKRSEAYVGSATPYVQYDVFNPFAPGLHDYTIGYQQYCHEYLWYVNYMTGEVVPWLAERHEYSDDYKTLRLILRKDVEWADGVPFTAEDIAFTMNMLKNDRTLVGPADVDAWDSIYADPNDPFTCVIEMKEPRPRQHTLWWCKVTSGQWIMPKHIWENVDPHTFTNNPPLGTGPYKWYGGYLEQQVVLWERNENYWGKKIGRFPAPKFLVGAKYGDPEMALELTRKHVFDTAQISYQVWLEHKDEFPTIQPFGFYNDACVRSYFFNCAKGPHLTKPEFRRAICMLMNREKWATKIYPPPGAPVAKGPWPGYANMDQFINEEAKRKWGTYEYNPTRAMELLTEIGYVKDGSVLKDPDGNPVVLRIDTPGSPNAGDIQWASALDLMTEMAALGIDASLKHFDSPVNNEMMYMGDFDIVSRWRCQTLDAVDEYATLMCKDFKPIGERSTTNRERLCDEEFDAVVNKLLKIEPAAPEAHDLYMEAFDHYLRLSPTTGTVETPVGTSSDWWYWENNLCDGNLYTVPGAHWPQYMFVFFNIRPSGREETSTS